MKTKNLSFVFKTCVLAGALAIGLAARASVIDLQLTEVDDNTLQITGGSDSSSWSIVENSADHWTATRSSAIVISANASPSGVWAEPDNTGNVNLLRFFATTNGDSFTVASDISLDSGRVADGTVISLNLNVVGTVSIPYTVQFIDQGDTPSTVPDYTYTAGCLVLGLIPLVWFQHRRTERQRYSKAGV